MKIIVTGGGGFVGSNIVDKLLKSGHEVLVIDNWSSGSIENLPKEVLGRNVLVDLQDYNLLAFSFELFRPDLVIHCAALMGVVSSHLQPELSLDNNVKGTLNVLEAMKFCGCKKIIYMSTSHVYGLTEDYPCKETSKLTTTSPYAESKKTGEEYVKLYKRTCNFNYTILRLGNCYGPNLKRGFIYNVIKGLVEFNDVTIYGDGTDTRDYVYIGDVCEAVILAIDNIQNLTFNISYGQETKSCEIYQIAQELVGIDRDYKMATSRNNDVSRIFLNVKLALDKLNWHAKTSLKEGIAKNIDWYKQNSGRISNTDIDKGEL